MNKTLKTTALCMCLLIYADTLHSEEQNASQIIRNVINKWRGQSSYTEMTMIIHRPEWERAISMRGWTRGEKDSLIRVTSPRKDLGTGTLTLDNRMWTYSPRINRVIKVPSSMMGQSWMGSDFSNKDVARADEIVTRYQHKLLQVAPLNDKHKVYLIEAIPKEDAAIVWGKQLLSVRDDYIVLREEFYDQDGILVKHMETLNVAIMDGQSIAQQQRMIDAEEENRWTEITVQKVVFDLALKANVFTLSNLRNPRN